MDASYVRFCIDAKNLTIAGIRNLLDKKIIDTRIEKKANHAVIFTVPFGPLLPGDRDFFTEEAFKDISPEFKPLKANFNPKTCLLGVHFNMKFC